MSTIYVQSYSASHLISLVYCTLISSHFVFPDVSYGFHPLFFFFLCNYLLMYFYSQVVLAQDVI
ncbi:hypothetical protein BDV11DRAFT_5601 [Aspergillus similis]